MVAMYVLFVSDVARHECILKEQSPVAPSNNALLETELLLK